jgi:hypothetical protein
MAAIPGDVSLEYVRSNFQSELLFEKELSRNDLEKIYLPPSDVSKICPHQQTPTELLFYDPGMTSWKMDLKKTTSERWHLMGPGWRRFVRKRKLKEGQKIKFYKHTCNRGTGASFFMIGDELILGSLV